MNRAYAFRAFLLVGGLAVPLCFADATDGRTLTRFAACAADTTAGMTRTPFAAAPPIKLSREPQLYGLERWNPTTTRNVPTSPSAMRWKSPPPSGPSGTTPWKEPAAAD